MDVRSRNHVTVTSSFCRADPDIARVFATGHCPQLSAPEETAAAITAFLGTAG
ncbi:hypothetical protein ABZ957_05770 [Streptomyces sp. NPDC046316]|uniref:hypothetical protein n=1 Tax=unclassified Streptomyces TaxID=2593676 RepID=UPI0033F6B153